MGIFIFLIILFNKQTPKSVRPSVLGIEPSSYSSGSKNSSQKGDPDMINLDIAVKQSYTDKMKLDKGKSSPSGQAHSVTNLRTIQQINQLLKPLNNKSSSSQHESNSNNSLSKVMYTAAVPQFQLELIFYHLKIKLELVATQ